MSTLDYTNAGGRLTFYAFMLFLLLEINDGILGWCDEVSWRRVTFPRTDVFSGVVCTFSQGVVDPTEAMLHWVNLNVRLEPSVSLEHGGSKCVCWTFSMGSGCLIPLVVLRNTPYLRAKCVSTIHWEPCVLMGGHHVVWLFHSRQYYIGLNGRYIQYSLKYSNV